MKIDDYIPFCELFIIPYLLWFAYIAVVIVYMGFKDQKEYFHLCAFLFTGMTLFLIVSTIYPNGHFLRPVAFERDNIFTQMCTALYSTDTATNLFPSIHVYNSIGVHLAVANSEKTRHNKPVRLSSGILMVSIILATVFLKQHSVFDVLTAFLTAAVVYTCVYIRTWEKAKKTLRVATMYTRRQYHRLKRHFAA
jgi:membrane-associated phospholipid phosphatase